MDNKKIILNDGGFCRERISWFLWVNYYDRSLQSDMIEGNIGIFFDILKYSSSRQHRACEYIYIYVWDFEMDVSNRPVSFGARFKEKSFSPPRLPPVPNLRRWICDRGIRKRGVEVRISRSKICWSENRRSCVRKMSAAKRSVRGRGKASIPLMSEKKMRVDDELDAELDLSRCILAHLVCYYFTLLSVDF